MNADTKTQLKQAGGLVALIAAVTTGGVFLADKTINPLPPPRTVTLQWDVNETTPSVVTEIWASTDLKTWTLKTNVTGTNRVTLPADQAAEFFKVRNRLNGRVSDWARKPSP